MKKSLTPDEEMDEIFKTVLVRNYIKELCSTIEPKNHNVKDDEDEIFEKMLNRASNEKKKNQLLGEVRAIIVGERGYNHNSEITNTDDKIELLEDNIVMRSWHVSCPAIITCYYEPISTLPLERWEQEKLLKYVKFE